MAFHIFLLTCSDCDVCFQALLHHIDLTRYRWTVVCNMLSNCENLSSFSIGIRPFETVVREEFLVSKILRLNKLRIRLWKARKISRTKFLTENLTRNCKNFCSPHCSEVFITSITNFHRTGILVREMCIS